MRLSSCLAFHGSGRFAELATAVAPLAQHPTIDAVLWVADLDGDGAGYDILSFEPDGRRRLIEVKTTTGVATTPFFLTRNEEAFARERPDEFRLARVYDFAAAPRMFELTPPLTDHVRLETETWRAGFR